MSSPETYALRRLLVEAQGPLAVERAVELALGVLRALEPLRAEGRAHGAIAPELIALEAGRPIHLLPVEPVENAVRYLAPERCAGEAPSAAADLYALGCVLFEMIAGRPPFTGVPAAVASQHQHAVPKAPGIFRPEVPEELDQLVLALLAKSPAARPDAARVKQALEEIAQIFFGATQKPELPSAPARRPAASAEVARSQAVVSTPEPAETQPPPARPETRRPRRQLLAVLILAPACAAIALFAFPNAMTQLAPGRERIAVVAIVDPDANDAASSTIAWPLAHRISAELDLGHTPIAGEDAVNAARLAVMGSDRLVPRNDVDCLRGIARRLDAGTVAAISLEPRGEALELAVRLHRPADRMLGMPAFTLQLSRTELDGGAARRIAAAIVKASALPPLVETSAPRAIPFAASALASRAAFSSLLGRYDTCELDARAAIARFEREPRFHLLLARALAHEQERAEEAAHELARARELQGESADPTLASWFDAEEAAALAEERIEDDDRAGASALLEKILAADEARLRRTLDPWALVHAAESARRYGTDPDRALASYRRARELAPVFYAAIRGEAELLGGRSDDVRGRRSAAMLLAQELACHPGSPIGSLLEHDFVIWNLPRPADDVRCEGDELSSARSR